MSRTIRERCCDCIPTQNRCSAGTNCPCAAAKRICDDSCESGRFRGDCLNQAICKCNCEAPEPPPPQQPTAVGGVKNSSASSSVLASPSLKNVCTKPERCECVRVRESCSKLCGCKQNCKNKDGQMALVAAKKITAASPASSSGAAPSSALVATTPKSIKPTQGCTCGTRSNAKKQCSKRECPCRAMYEFCISGKCKCSGDCSNGPSKFAISKQMQQCFLEHKNESSALILTLIGDDYIYRMDFFHDSKQQPHVEEQMVQAVYDLTSKYKTDLYELIVYVSKSPCFHQDCDPKCEVVDECKSNKACAKLLSILLYKVRKELSKVDVKMSVKFLYPHLHRGDLYTKQGLLCMLQSGIKVEPLLMKDWSYIIDWSPPPSSSTNRNATASSAVVEHKNDYLQLWNTHNLDKAVAQSQSFINECRRALSLPMKFWVAEIHEIVKNTILNYTDIKVKLHELTDALKCLDLTATPHKIRSTPSKRRSFIDMLELRDKLHLSGGSSSGGGGGGSSARGTNDSHHYHRYFHNDHPHNQSHGHHHRGGGKKKDGSSQSLPSAEDAHAQQMVASFCGRSFDDAETNEIAQRIRRATANINLEIESLLEYLGQKGTI